MINTKVIINGLVIKTLRELRPLPRERIEHIYPTELLGGHFHVPSLGVLGFAVVAWAINIIEVYAFQ